MKGDRSFIISVEKDGQCLGAGTYTGSREYIPALCGICRFIQENLSCCIVRILAPDCKERILHSVDIERFAGAARVAGINYE